jgi:hypothetical protein
VSDQYLRWALHGAVIGTLVITWFVGGRAHAESYTASDTYYAIDEASAEMDVSWHRLYWIVRCETGGTFNPYSIGRARELGAVQLHPRGELPRFYAYGYSDPFNPYEAVRFLAQRLLAGGARAWTCA